MANEIQVRRYTFKYVFGRGRSGRAVDCGPAMTQGLALGQIVIFGGEQYRVTRLAPPDGVWVVKVEA